MGAKKIKLSNRGQSLIETLMFIPLLLGTLTTIMGIAGAINTSINQQKVVRGYFYNRLGGNSFAPRAQNLLDMKGVTKVSMLTYGWSVVPVTGDEKPVGLCHKMINVLGKKDSSDKCENPLGGATQQIHINTVYGICSTNYDIDGTKPMHRFEGVGGQDIACRLTN